jgi:hypothetical protein
VQVALKSLPLIWHSRWTFSAKMGSSLLLGLQLGLPCFLILSTAFLVDIAQRGFGLLHGTLICLAAFIAVGSAIAITLPPFRRLRRGDMVSYGATLIMLPILLVFLALANSASVVAAPFFGRQEFVRTPKTGGR